MLLVVAPMDGFTDCAFRIIIKNVFDKYNVNDNLLMVTEFMSADGYVKNPAGVVKHILKTQIDKPLVAQIFGGNEDTLVQTASSLSRLYDFDGIELNIGCPSPKIINNGGGSGLLKDKKRTLQIIKSMSESVNTNFSIKTRSGLYETDKQKQFDFIVASSEYCDMITVHARTFAHGHVGEVDWDYVYQLKQKINPKCKLIGNGGIKTYLDASEKLGNLDGIMIGQACMGNPWVFVEHAPSMGEVREMILEHLQLSACMEIYFASQPFETVDGEFTLKMPSLEQIDKIKQLLIKKQVDGKLFCVKEFRKHLFTYVKGLLGSKPFKQNVISIIDYYELIDEINRYFDEIKNRY